MSSYKGIPGMVSIIMPSYNCSSYIERTINSVLAQTYENWELIVVDDCSTDDTYEKLKGFESKDIRIKILLSESNSGAAAARNKALKSAEGEYIAFLDSDDTWEVTKLQKQISFMKTNNYLFTCTYYDKINESGDSLNRIITYKKRGTYSDLLKNCPGNSTVIYNASGIGEKVYISNIKKRNDYLMWLKVIKKTDKLYCLDEVLSSHRIRNGSLSKNKFSLIKYHWEIYREKELLGFIYSLYLVLYWVAKPIFKKIL